MEHTLYHSVLRIFTLTLALVLLFDSGLISSTSKELSSNTQQYLASAIGMNASVVPTDLNQMTAQLQEQQRALEEREIAVSLRESETATASQSDTSTLFLSAILFLLLMLIMLNYVIDFMRYQQSKSAKPAT